MAKCCVAKPVCGARTRSGARANARTAEGAAAALTTVDAPRARGRRKAAAGLRRLNVAGGQA
jgi:hypothetical protein